MKPGQEKIVAKTLKEKRSAEILQTRLGDFKTNTTHPQAATKSAL